MFARSNSLSINTGAANSTLYVSPPLPPPPSFPSVSSPSAPHLPRLSGPTLLGPTIYSGANKPLPGPSKLRNDSSQWDDRLPSTVPYKEPKDVDSPHTMQMFPRLCGLNLTASPRLVRWQRHPLVQERHHSVSRLWLSETLSNHLRLSRSRSWLRQLRLRCRIPVGWSDGNGNGNGCILGQF
jgi:hypothetical protein